MKIQHYYFESQHYVRYRKSVSLRYIIFKVSCEYVVYNIILYLPVFGFCDRRVCCCCVYADCHRSKFQITLRRLVGKIWSRTKVTLHDAIQKLLTSFISMSSKTKMNSCLY